MAITVIPSVTRIVQVGPNIGQNVLISGLETRLISSGAYLESLITVSNAGVSTLNLKSGNVLLSGLGGTLVINSGQTIWISGGGSSNTGSFVTTGQTGHNHDTQYYPLTSNPSGYITTGQTGQFASDADISNVQSQITSITSWTGTADSIYVNHTETGQFASVANLFSTGSTLALWSGTTTGLYYPRTGNPSGFVLSSATGNFITVSQTGQFASAINLFNTGSNLQGQINSITSWTGTTASLYYPLSTNPSGYVTFSVLTGASGVLGDRLNSTGSYLFGLINASSAGVSSLNSASGALSLVGAGNVSVTTNGQTITVSGDTGLFVTTGQTGVFATVTNLALTGSNIANWTGTTTGLYYPRFLNPSGYITGLNTGNFVTSNQTGAFSSVSVTGSPILTYANFTGTSGVLLVTGVSGLIKVDGGSLQVQITNVTNWTGTTTSLFYPLNSNPSGYATTGYVTGASGILSDRLISTGSYLFGLINASSAGVSSLNSASGALSLVGAGNVSVTTNGQTITVSGNTGIYSSFVTTGQTGNFVTTNQTGGFSTVVVTGSPILNYANFTGTSGILLVTGVSGQVKVDGGNLQSQITTITNWTGTADANYVNHSETGQFASAANLATTGLTLSSWTGSSTGLYYPRTGNPSGFITGINTGNFVTTSQTGDFSTVVVTGSPALKYVNLTGTSGIYVSTGVSGLVIVDGGNLQNQIISVTNWTGTTPLLYYPRNTNPSGYVDASHGHNYVTGISVTGSIPLTGLIDFTGIGGLLIIKTGNTIQFSGGAGGAGEANTASNLGVGVGVFSGKQGVDLAFYTLTGVGGTTVIRVGTEIQISGGGSSSTSGQVFPVAIDTTNIATGSALTFIQFPQNFAITPTILGNIVNNSGEPVFGFNISGVTVSGFYLATSDLINTNNYKFSYFATTGSGYFNVGSAPGDFYLNSNPSGYITTGQTGQFASDVDVSIVQTQVTALNNWTGSSTGIFYPLTGNPSGFVMSSQTGQFASDADVANVQAQINTITSWTGTADAIYVNHTETGQFASDVDVATVQTQVNTLNTWTGSSTGIFYPLTGNPSGFVMSSQTGQFASAANLFSTGATLTAWTGTTTGLYYPLKTNPSGYVLSTETGQFASDADILTIQNWTGTTTGLYYPRAGNPSGFITSIITGTGISVSITNNIATVSTYFDRQFSSGLQANLLMVSGQTYYTALSGDVGAGTWLTTASINFQTPPNSHTILTAKIWNANNVWGANQINTFASGAGNSGLAAISFAQIITVTGVSNPVALSAASNRFNCWINSAPINFATGILSGASTFLEMIRLY